MAILEGHAVLVHTNTVRASFAAKEKKLRGKQNTTGLPRFMTVRRRRRLIYFYSIVAIDGKRTEIPLGLDRESAITQHYEYAKAYNLRIDVPKIEKPSIGHAEHLYKKLVRNAKNRGIVVSITQGDVEELFERSGYQCELTGISFDMTKNKLYRVRPWVPSVDRIDSSRPYTTDNCRLVCAAVNSALGQYGEETLVKIAKMLLEKRVRDLRAGR